MCTTGIVSHQMTYAVIVVELVIVQFLGKASTIVRINQDEDVTLKLQKGTILIHVKFIELQH